MTVKIAKYSLLLLAFLTLAIGLDSSAAKADPWAASRFRTSAVREAAMLNLSALAGDATSVRSAAAKGLEALEGGLTPALDGVKGKADLTKAVKEFYLAARSYFEQIGGGASRPQIERAEAEMDTKSAALEMELKLAGFGS